MRRFWISAGFSLLFMAIISMCLFANAEVYSGDCGANGDNVKWELDTETGVLDISGEGEMRDYSYAPKIGYNVKAPWLEYSNSIKSVVVENGVLNISSETFVECTNLKEVSIPDSVVKIEYGAFSGCDALRSVTIPKSVTFIGQEAFYSSGLESIVIPDSVSYIGDEAFAGAELYYNHDNWKDGLFIIDHCLLEIRLEATTTYIVRGDTTTEFTTDKAELKNGVFYVPDDIRIISSRVFAYLDDVKSIVIPKSVTNISDMDTFGCSELTSIIVSEDNRYYSSDENGILFNKEKTEIICYPYGKKQSAYTIPDSVTTIAPGAFNGSELINITIPESVTIIGNNAFRSCSKLENINIPNGVSRIETQTFMGCDNLKCISLPETVLSIGDYTFWVCESLESIIIHGDVEEIGESAFETFNENTVIYGIPGSLSETKAKLYQLAFIALPTETTTIGTIINQYLHTDIKAIIDGKTIRSYNIDGNTAIIAEDLAAYGFNVVWNGENRTLSVEEGDKTVKGGFEGEASAGKVGTPAGDVLYTDIITYVNGKQVTSYNIGGMTAIPIDDLAIFGNVKWDGDARTISFNR